MDRPHAASRSCTSVSNAAAHRGRPHLAEQLGGSAVGEHLALVQHDHPRALADFVDQMRGPKRGQAFVAAEPAHVVEHELPAGDVEPDRRLVEQQQARLVQQSARDLDTAPLAAAQLPRLVAALVDKPDALDLGGDPSGCVAARQAMQGAVVVEVLLDGEVEIEGRLLEHDPHLPQALQHPLANVHAEDADRALGLGVEPGGKREQCRLPGAVKPEQHGEIAGRDRERDIFQHPPRPEAVPEPLDRQCRGDAHERLTGGRRRPTEPGRPERI